MTAGRERDDLLTLGRRRQIAGRRAAEVLWLDDADPLVRRAAVPAMVDARCRDARVEKVQAPRRAREIVATISTSAVCPLTFATSFTEDLRANATLTDGGRVAVAVLPGYGALASVLAPAGATAIALHAEPPRLPFAIAWVALGLACGAGAAWLIARQRQ